MPEKTGQSLPDLLDSQHGAETIEVLAASVEAMSPGEQATFWRSIAEDAIRVLSASRAENERLRTALERALMHVMYLGPGWRIITEALHPTAAVASDERQEP